LAKYFAVIAVAVAQQKTRSGVSVLHDL
jgi:hypothetical protein